MRNGTRPICVEHTWYEHWGRPLSRNYDQCSYRPPGVEDYFTTPFSLISMEDQSDTTEEVGSGAGTTAKRDFVSCVE